MTLPKGVRVLLPTCAVFVVAVLVWLGRFDAPSAQKADAGPSASTDSVPGMVTVPEVTVRTAALAESVIGEQPKVAASADAEPRDSIKGRVQNTRGAEIAGIAVFFYALDSESHLHNEHPTAVATADMHGRFSIPWNGDYGRVLARSTTLVTLMPFEVTSKRLVTNAIVLVAERVEYAGWVRDDLGAPVPGASIEISLEQARQLLLLPGETRSHALSWRTESREDGSFDFDSVGWVDGLEMTGNCPGFRQCTIKLPQYSTPSIVLTLQRESDPDCVDGIVVDCDGRPVGGAHVYLGTSATLSDSAGRFALRRRDAHSIDKVAAFKRGWLPAETILLPAGSGPTKGVVLVLDPNTRSIAGTVTTSGGAAVAGARVCIADPTALEATHVYGPNSVAIGGVFSIEDIIGGSGANLALGPAVSGSDGRFEITGLLARRYSLLATEARNMRTTVVPDVQAGTHDLRIVLREDEELRRVSGRVVSRAGAPIPGIRVVYRRRVKSESGRLPVGADPADCPVTDQQGRFDFESICVGDAYLILCGEGLCADQNIELDTAADLDNLELVACAACSFQVHLAQPEEADAFMMIDAAGKPLHILYTIGGDTHGSLVCPLFSGNSEVGRVCEGATTLVLIRGRSKGRSIAVSLVAGELTSIIP